MESKITDKVSHGPDVWVTLFKIIFFIFLGAIFIGLRYASSVDHTEPLGKDPVNFIEEWKVTDPDGNVRTCGSSLVIEKPTEDIYIMEATLPDNITDDSYICSTVGRNIEVFIDDELRWDFDEDRDIIIPGGCVKRFYMTVPINRSDSGKVLKMIRHGSSRRGQVYADVFIATDNGFFNFLLDHYGIPLMLAEILAVFSIIISVISIIMMLLYKQRIDMLYGALAVLDFSAWTITNSFLYPFVYGHYHIDGFFNYLLCLLMPFCPLFYINTLQHGRYKKIVNVLLAISTVNFVLWPTLHVLKIFSLSYALLYIDIILGIEIFIMMGVLFVDLLRNNVREYKYTAIGFMGLMICGLFEVVVLNFYVSMYDDVPLQIGLMFMLTMTVVQQIYDLRVILREKQKAMDMSQAKTKFLASMSHEIRTPINAILGMNEMILRDNEDPAIGDYAQSVKSSGKMLLMLVNDVLDFSKIEAGKLEINHVQFYMSKLLKDIMPMLKERADEKNLELRTVILCDIPNGQISDEFRIRQILINLIGNAIKYTDTGSVTLILGGEYTEDNRFILKMNIKDTGRGIKEQDQQKLFDAFTRIDLKRNGNIEGTGLGLAIVKSIIEAMHGTITVTSEFGVGSEFTAAVPVEVFDNEPLDINFANHTEAIKEEKNICDYKAPEAAILAVDDNRTNLKIVKLFLQRAGIKPDLCDNGTDACSMCREKKYDLILLDHMMPTPDGIETLHMIKTDPESINKETTVIVLTANAIANSRNLYLAEGFSDYLTKPIDAGLLEQTVKKYLPADKIIPID